MTFFNEDLSDEQIKLFRKQKVLPYLKHTYSDLLLRQGQHEALLFSTVIEYCHLPGIVADRFAHLMLARDDYIPLVLFCKIMC